MTKTTAHRKDFTKEQILDWLKDGYDGLPVTGAQEESRSTGEAKDDKFYDADMWISHIRAYGFSEDSYDHIEVRTVYDVDGKPSFCYLVFLY